MQKKHEGKRPHTHAMPEPAPSTSLPTGPSSHVPHVHLLRLRNLPIHPLHLLQQPLPPRLHNPQHHNHLVHLHQDTLMQPTTPQTAGKEGPETHPLRVRPDCGQVPRSPTTHCWRSWAAMHPSEARTCNPAKVQTCHDAMTQSRAAIQANRQSANQTNHHTTAPTRRQTQT